MTLFTGGLKMAYYSLLYSGDWNTWGIEFGDYSREAVEEERDAMRESMPEFERFPRNPSIGMPRYNSPRRFKILRHRNDKQATIDADAARLNAEWKEWQVKIFNLTTF